MIYVLIISCMAIKALEGYNCEVEQSGATYFWCNTLPSPSCLTAWFRPNLAYSTVDVYSSHKMWFILLAVKAVFLPMAHWTNI